MFLFINNAFAGSKEKLRVVVMTDITWGDGDNLESDDVQSLIRYLLYANEFDTEGLLATTSCYLPEKVRPDIIRYEIEKGYVPVYLNLLKRSPNYPSPAELLQAIKAGFITSYG